MSISLRRKIGFWFLFIIGVSTISFQTYKYFTNQLFDSQMELVVFIIGLALTIMPQYILRLFEKIIIKKENR